MNEAPTLVEPLPRSSTTLNQEAYRRLEEMIVTLELAPGSLVSEAILSRQLGIGTTPIREALQRLAREYLVDIIPRRGGAWW
jgi:DNA-binding GntR family transcriptional regulator